MNKVYHINSTYYGQTATIIIEDGYAYVMVTIMRNNPEDAIIHDLVVHQDRRGEGLGRELLDEAVEMAGAMGAKVAILSVEPGSWLEEWYGRHGFKDTGATETVFDVEHKVLQRTL